MSTSVLIVDDDVDAAQLMCSLLVRHGYEAATVATGEACLAALAARGRDIVVTDLGMPDMTGIELCRRLHVAYPEVPVIVVTGAAGVEPAIEAIRVGAYDYLTKPLKSDVLEIAVARVTQQLDLRRELRQLRQRTAAENAERIAGESPKMVTLNELIGHVAAGDVTVLITGESGTGKELVARALHDKSARRDEPFVAVNCAAMPAPLLESELFGHERGAFTDAHTARQGLFTKAKAGTLFLDEIGELPLEMQVKLLRVLQERRVRPVGGDQELEVKARIVTATNRDLEQEVEAKRFRADLYYRINVVPIAVPPLRDRGRDVMVLAQRFLVRAARRAGRPIRGFTTSAAIQLMEYDWPGNVRELENCIESAVAISVLDEITISDLPAKIVAAPRAAAEMPSLALDELITLDEMARRYVRTVLDTLQNNKTHAAKVLGIDRRSLYRRLANRSVTSTTTDDDP